MRSTIIIAGSLVLIGLGLFSIFGGIQTHKEIKMIESQMKTAVSMTSVDTVVAEYQLAAYEDAIEVILGAVTDSFRIAPTPKYCARELPKDALDRPVRLMWQYGKTDRCSVLMVALWTEGADRRLGTKDDVVLGSKNFDIGQERSHEPSRK